MSRAPARIGMGASRTSDRSVLVVEDDAAVAELVSRALGNNARTASAESTVDALTRFATEPFDVVVTALRSKGIDGLELCHRIHEAIPDTPVVVVTSSREFDDAVAAMAGGAHNVLAKPLHFDSVAHAMVDALRHRGRAVDAARLWAPCAGFGQLVGTSGPMQDLYALLARLASSDSSVLVSGESGTGKELVARALHDGGPRAQGPFIAINCAAMPEGLLESELFGHAKGAFTDAKTARPGLFVDASGGTLFLDEVGELPVGLQAKLLRALQERTVRPIGQRKEIPFDVRLIAATNADLRIAIHEKRFREDLYFRLNVVELELPPLRSRGNDVLVLAHLFLSAFAAKVAKPLRGFSPDAAKRLLEHAWPGNVRELQNAIERAVALATTGLVTIDDLPTTIVQAKRTQVLLADDPSELVTLEAMEARYIRHVLRVSGGSKVIAAKTLGLDRTTLWRKLDRIRKTTDAF